MPRTRIADDRELRLRRRIDQLTDERDQIAYERDSWRDRALELTALVTKLRRRIYQLFASRELWRVRAMQQKR